MLSGISLPDQPNGIPSVLVTAQDSSFYAADDTLSQRKLGANDCRPNMPPNSTGSRRRWQQGMKNVCGAGERLGSSARSTQERLNKPSRAQAAGNALAERDALHRQLMAEHESDQTIVERFAAPAKTGTPRKN